MACCLPGWTFRWRCSILKQMLRELGKAVSFIASLAALYAMMGSAFFSPGSRWQQRLLEAAVRLAFAGCVCMASGTIFALAGGEGSDVEDHRHADAPHLFRTLPVRLFLWATAAATILFLLSWYLEEYYVPLLWRNQPH
jgi:hypothetical protein